ncbi:MAG TPA: polysaccharide pyruvyl transferase family protein [Trebonia sp.]|jgi:polysaccharide pyruvyl transferase WcaK-like protein|nr:polysaccharide pyruvyl transferase family protein [Trebonia sp.]
MKRCAVGFFGILGAGNIGNDAQLESLLAYVRRAHPEAAIDAMCSGPDQVRARYGIDAIPLRWQQRYERRTWRGRSTQGTAATARNPRVKNLSLLAVGMFADAFRITRWVRRHDVVIVPGAGVLESSLLLRPWGTPYVLFILCLAGKAFRTKVALVAVGANVINQPLTRWLDVSAAKLAYYRSYRDEFSRESMRAQGVDTSGDSVYADLAFGIPPLSDDPGDPDTVGIGLMAYYGTNDDRQQAKELHEAYIGEMQLVVRWLADNGRRVRLFVGETNGGDDDAISRIRSDLRAYRPDLPADWTLAPVTHTFDELMAAMTPASVILATRYHNVLCALKLAKPTISIGYSAKHDVLMTELGLGEFCHPIKSIDAKTLIGLVEELESRKAELIPLVAERHQAKADLLDRQFAELSAALF